MLLSTPFLEKFQVFNIFFTSPRHAFKQHQSKSDFLSFFLLFCLIIIFLFQQFKHTLSIPPVFSHNSPINAEHNMLLYRRNKSKPQITQKSAQ